LVARPAETDRDFGLRVEVETTTRVVPIPSRKTETSSSLNSVRCGCEWTQRCDLASFVPARPTRAAPLREIIAGSAAGGLGVDLRINHARRVPRRAQSACPVRPVNRGITQCPRRRRRRLGPRCVRHSLHHAIGRPRRIAAVVPRTFRCGSNRTTRGRYAVIQGSGSTCRFDQSELPDFINRREN